MVQLEATFQHTISPGQQSLCSQMKNCAIKLRIPTRAIPPCNIMDATVSLFSLRCLTIITTQGRKVMYTAPDIAPENLKNKTFEL